MERDEFMLMKRRSKWRSNDDASCMACSLMIGLFVMVGDRIGSGEIWSSESDQAEYSGASHSTMTRYIECKLVMC